MFLEELIKQSPVIATLSIGIFTYIFNTKASTIRRKTKAEVKQKLELDSIVGIINETEEFKRAIKSIINCMATMSDAILLGYSDRAIPAQSPITYIANLIRKKTAPQDIRNCIMIEFQKNITIYSEKMAKFISMLEKDIIINGRDRKVKSGIRKIDKVRTDMFKDLNILGKKKSISDSDIKMLGKILNDITEKSDIIETINKSVDKILKIYTKKLN